MSKSVPANRAGFRGAHVLVLGATGFLGRWVARALSQAGAELTLVSRSAAAAPILEQWGVSGVLRIANLQDRAEARRVVTEVAPDVVFNLAGYGVDRAERDARVAHALNAQLPIQLAEAVAMLPATEWRGARLVHVGSALEYGVAEGDLREDSVALPTTVYGRTKHAGTVAVTRIAREKQLRAVTARLFTVFGPGEHPGRLFPTLVRAAGSTGGVALTDGIQRRDFAFAGDVADKLLQLAMVDASPGEVINLASGAMHPVRDFVTVAASTLGIARKRLNFGTVEVLPDEMAHSSVVVDRLQTMTGAALSTDLAEIIGRAVGAAKLLRWRPEA
ncbi:MAG: GDP-mannose 4,6-dehydratase [Gemmatimonadaceae bacterium]|nr:GDP-mannose 4,6-dehydratase [Gemmatimonadaceae bacterium]